MLVIAWRCLTGRYIAASFTDREQAEWPPHPDRVFQALVAAWGERGEDREEREALEWLESLEPPSLSVPDPEDMPVPVKTYVPTNDLEASDRERKSGDYNDKLKGLLPSNRPRKERFFPYVRIGESIMALIWPDADPGRHLDALKRLAGSVVRIGHSSSLVHCWVEENAPSPKYLPGRPKRPGGLQLRTPERGRLALLAANYSRSKEAKSYLPPPPARQIPYQRASEQEISTPHAGFSDQLLVFSQHGGERFSYLHTLDLTSAFRAALIKCAQGVAPLAMPLVSGHALDGTPLPRAHAAFLPLGFSGSSYSDGHLLGMALALPENLAPEEEDAVYGTIANAVDADGGLALFLGEKGCMRLRLIDRVPQIKALDPLTWTKPSCVWSSVTPIVADRMAKPKRAGLEAWAEAEIAEACIRRGLPKPIQLSVSAVPFISGSFPCYRSSDALKGRGGRMMFPPLVRKNGESNWMFHARIVFGEPVRGPVLLGAGRYRGYGLLKPEIDSENREGVC